MKFPFPKGLPQLHSSLKKPFRGPLGKSPTGHTAKERTSLPPTTLFFLSRRHPPTPPPTPRSEPSSFPRETCTAGSRRRRETWGCTALGVRGSLGTRAAPSTFLWLGAAKPAWRLPCVAAERTLRGLLSQTPACLPAGRTGDRSIFTSNEPVISLLLGSGPAACSGILDLSERAREWCWAEMPGRTLPDYDTYRCFFPPTSAQSPRGSRCGPRATCLGLQT